MSAARLQLSRSWILAGAILALHTAAAASVFGVVGGWGGLALAIGFVGLGTAAAWARALHGSPASVRALELADGALVELKDGRRFAVEVGPGRYVTRFVVSLPLRRPSRRTVLVTRDMLSAEEFRRLCLWALWGKLPRVAHKQLPA